MFLLEKQEQRGADLPNVTAIELGGRFGPVKVTSPGISESQSPDGIIRAKRVVRGDLEAVFCVDIDAEDLGLIVKEKMLKEKKSKVHSES